MSSYFLRRLAMSVATLWLLSVLAFAGGRLLPGNVGRAMLGPFADQRAVDVRNHELGTDRPILVQYGDWIGSFVQGDFGKSYAYNVPVADLLWPALANSARLGVLALLLVVPLGVSGGVVAALNRERFADRAISVLGVSLTSIPEFVSGIVLLLLLGRWARLLPMFADFPPNAGVLTQIYYLILPATPLVLVLFGYIARMSRSGMIEALDADYTRTAILKGLTYRQVIWRHVLRNALLPTISVIATQTVYLLGGLLAIEHLFHYQGVGSLIVTAASKKDFPLLQSAVMAIGAIFALVTLGADLLYSLLNPRIRLSGA